jgi:putative ABC transport system permease protein
MTTPPKFLLWLLERLYPSNRPDLKGDFLELYQDRVEAIGRTKANWRFVHDIITVIPFKLIVKQSYQPPINMFSTNLKIARRNLVKNKLYSIINVTGLSVSLAACILIALFVQDELSYDKHFPDFGNIYRITGNYDHGGPERVLAAPTTFMLLPAMSGNLKNVEYVTRADFRWETIKVVRDKEEKQFLEPHIIYADSTFFEVFALPFISGDPGSVLDDPSSVVIDRQTAYKYFDTENVLGKQIQLHDKMFTVSGIFHDMPSNSHFNGNIIFPIEGIKQWYQDWVTTNPTGTSVYTYLKGNEYLDVAETESTIDYITKKWSSKSPEYFLQPLKSIHLGSHLAGEIGENGSEITVYLFSTIALIILILACINFINLSTAGSLQRVKEVGMKRVLGSTATMQVTQFQVESFLVVMIAVFIAVAISALSLPFFNAVSGKFMEPKVLGDPLVLSGIFLIAMTIGIVSGAFPAFTLLRHKTMSMLSGSVSFKNARSAFRNSLIVFQFAVTVALITSTLVVISQLNFIQTKDLGMNPHQVVMIPLETDAVSHKYEQLRTEMLRSSLIQNVSASTYKLTYGVGGWRPYEVNWQKEPLNIPTACVSVDFFETMGINFLHGRGYSREFPADATESFVINESAAKFLKLDDPVGAPLAGATFTGSEWFEKKGKIIGVFKDVNFGSLHAPPGPLVLNLGSNTTESFGWIEVKIAGSDVMGAMATIENLWKKLVPDAPFQFEFMEDGLQNNYVSERRFLKVFLAFSVLSIIIGCLGLFGLTAFMSKRRTKEIGIRKVVGASTGRLVGLLSKDFLTLVLISNIIGWPAAYYLMTSWLQNFAYRIQLSPWFFVLTGIAALIIAFAAVLYHALQASRANPVKALKYE